MEFLHAMLLAQNHPPPSPTAEEVLSKAETLKKDTDHLADRFADLKLTLQNAKTLAFLLEEMKTMIDMMLEETQIVVQEESSNLN